MSTAPRFTPLVDSLPATIPFVGPETLERRRGEAFRVRVGANESAFGVSPKAAEAMRDHARALLARLQDEGVFVRMPGVAPLDRCIRVTVGTADERALFADIFESVVNRGRAHLTDS